MQDINEITLQLLLLRKKRLKDMEPYQTVDGTYTHPRMFAYKLLKTVTKIVNECVLVNTDAELNAIYWLWIEIGIQICDDMGYNVDSPQEEPAKIIEFRRKVS